MVLQQFLLQWSIEFPRALFWALCSSLDILHLSAKLFRAWNTFTLLCDNKTHKTCWQISNQEIRDSAMKNWMSENFLLLNLKKKTEILVIAPKETPRWSGVCSSQQLCYFLKFNRQESSCYFWFCSLFWSAYQRNYQDCLLPPAQYIKN